VETDTLKALLEQHLVQCVQKVIFLSDRQYHFATNAALVLGVMQWLLSVISVLPAFINLLREKTIAIYVKLGFINPWPQPQVAVEFLKVISVMHAVLVKQVVHQ
jgi:hypothetical protein